MPASCKATISKDRSSNDNPNKYSSTVQVMNIITS